MPPELCCERHRRTQPKDERETFGEGRKDNEGMRGLDGRGSLWFLGHAFGSSSLATAA